MSEMHKLTSYSDGFGIFNKVAEHEFDVDNKNYLRLFMLNTENKLFNYDELYEYLLPNIARYVFDRKRLAEAEKNPVKQSLILIEAIEHLRKITSDKDRGAGGELGEVLLYLFLEQDLKAPKLFSNVYILIDDKRKQKYFDEVLLKPLPNQELLPQKALEKKHKKAIVSTLLQGKTNLIEAGEKYSDRGFTETSYEYATKCLNMLVHDICAKNDSYIVRDFRKDDVLTPQNIIDIRRIFGEIVSKDDDINISALQKYSLYQAGSNTEISYPDNFDYHTCLSFLKKLSQIFNWPIYEKGTLGKGDRLNYYTVILLQWMEDHGLHEIIRGAISHYQEQGGRLVSYDPTYHLEKYNGSANHKNQVINEAMKDIEQIINYKFSMYFLRFSEAIIKIRGEKALINDWYEYVEYGTCNEQVIGLQKHGFLREQALLLTKNPYSAFVAYLDGQLKISSEIFEVSDEDMLETLGTVRINYPEIFVDGESE